MLMSLNFCQSDFCFRGFSHVMFGRVFILIDQPLNPNSLLNMRILIGKDLSTVNIAGYYVDSMRMFCRKLWQITLSVLCRLGYQILWHNNFLKSNS